MEEKQNQNQPVRVYENPASKRIEIHSRHQKLVVRDLKTTHQIICHSLLS